MSPTPLLHAVYSLAKVAIELIHTLHVLCRIGTLGVLSLPWRWGLARPAGCCPGIWLGGPNHQFRILYLLGRLRCVCLHARMRTLAKRQGRKQRWYFRIRNSLVAPLAVGFA